MSGKSLAEYEIRRVKRRRGRRTTTTRKVEDENDDDRGGGRRRRAQTTKALATTNHCIVLLQAVNRWFLHPKNCHKDNDTRSASPQNPKQEAAKTKQAHKLTKKDGSQTALRPEGVKQL